MVTTPTGRSRAGVALSALTALAAAATLATGPSAASAVTAAPTSLARMAATAGLTTGTSSYCGLEWGSMAKANAIAHTSGTVSNVRAGRHTCYDRLVIDVADVPKSLSYDVRYVDAVRQEGSGSVVPLAGGAKLRVVVRAPAYDSSGSGTYTPANKGQLVDVSGWTTFRQVAWAGSFEGQTTVGLGVRARLPFRVTVLDGPGDGARLVIDVAHRW